MTTVYPYPVESPSVYSATKKGTELYDEMLLDQYRGKPNLRQYHLAYMEEFDLLLSEIEKVYLGRFLENAFGAQLDVCGEILNQKRNIELPRIWFGFQGADNVDGFGNENDAPIVGGIFKDESLTGYVTYPLDDSAYRKLLMAKASLLNLDECNIDNMYRAVTILLGKVPQIMRVDSTEDRNMTLFLSNTDTTSTDRSLVSYLSEYFVPVGTNFIITDVTP